MGRNPSEGLGGSEGSSSSPLRAVVHEEVSEIRPGSSSRTRGSFRHASAVFRSSHATGDAQRREMVGDKQRDKLYRQKCLRLSAINVGIHRQCWLRTHIVLEATLRINSQYLVSKARREPILYGKGLSLEWGIALAMLMGCPQFGVRPHRALRVRLSSKPALLLAWLRANRRRKPTRTRRISKLLFPTT